MLARRAYLVSVVDGVLGFSRGTCHVNLRDDSGDAPIVVLVSPQAVDGDA